MPPQSLQRAWKRVSFLRRLSGLTSEPPSMQSSALTYAREQAARELTSCTAESLASRTALRESNSGPTIHAISGLQPCEFLRRLSLGCSSSKTSLGCSATCPQGLSLICDGLGTSCLDRSCLKLQAWERRSVENGCSSWPTPNSVPEAPNSGLNRGEDHGGVRARHKSQCLAEHATQTTQSVVGSGPHLCASVEGQELLADIPNRSQKSQRRGQLDEATEQLWPTPNATAANDGETPETWQARVNAIKLHGINGNGAGTPLAIAAQLWSNQEQLTMSIDLNYQKPLPGETSNDYWKRMEEYEKAHGITPEMLSGGVTWETPPPEPDAIVPTKQAEQLTLLATPMVPNGGRNGARTEEGREGKESGIEHQTAQWATPTRNANADCPAERQRNTPAAAAAMLMESLTGPQVQPTEANGSESSPSVQTSRRRLSPRFVEWLMGVPYGWTQLASMNSEAWEIWSCRSRALLRS